MAEDVGVEWVIEAMRKILQRKQRRTVDRIIQAVRRKYRDVSITDIYAFLDQAERRGLIEKMADDKSIFFYRECKSFEHKPSGKNVVQNLLTQVIISVLEDSSAPCPMKNLVKCVRSRDLLDTPGDFNWRRQVRLAVRSLVKNGLIEQVGESLRLSAGVDKTRRNNKQVEVTCNASEGSFESSISLVNTIDRDEIAILTNNFASVKDNSLSSNLDYFSPQIVNFEASQTKMCLFDANQSIQLDQSCAENGCADSYSKKNVHLLKKKKLQHIALGLQTEINVFCERNHGKVIESENYVDLPRRHSPRGTPVKDNKLVCPTSHYRPTEIAWRSNNESVAICSRGDHATFTVPSNYDCSDVTASLQSLSRVIETCNIILEDHGTFNNCAGSDVMNCSQLLRDVIGCSVQDQSTNNNLPPSKDKCSSEFILPDGVELSQLRCDDCGVPNNSGIASIPESYDHVSSNVPRVQPECHNSSTAVSDICQSPELRPLTLTQSSLHSPVALHTMKTSSVENITLFNPSCPFESAVVADDAGLVTPSGPSPNQSPTNRQTNGKDVQCARKFSRQVKILADDLTKFYEPVNESKRQRLIAPRRSTQTAPTQTARDLQLEVIRKQITLVASRRKQAAERLAWTCDVMGNDVENVNKAVNCESEGKILSRSSRDGCNPRKSSYIATAKRNAKDTTSTEVRRRGRPPGSVSKLLKQSIRGVPRQKKVEVRRRGRPPGSISKLLKQSFLTRKMKQVKVRRCRRPSKRLRQSFRSGIKERGKLIKVHGKLTNSNGVHKRAVEKRCCITNETTSQSTKPVMTMYNDSTSCDASDQPCVLDISESDRCLFQVAHQVLDTETAVTQLADHSGSIVIGSYEMFTSSHDVVTSRVYLCECCLVSLTSYKSLQRHMLKQGVCHINGNEIYRYDGMSVYELDGLGSEACCLRLEELALRLKGQVVQNDSANCLYYVLYKYIDSQDQKYSQLIGFFSKLKSPVDSLKSVLVFPQFRHQHYGRWLVDLFYQLCRRNGNCQVLSLPRQWSQPVAAALYNSFCKSSVLQSIMRRLDQSSVDIKTICGDTGLADDVIEASLARLKLNVEEDGVIHFPSKAEIEQLADDDKQRHLSIELSCIDWNMIDCKRRRGRPRRREVERFKGDVVRPEHVIGTCDDVGNSSVPASCSSDVSLMTVLPDEFDRRSYRRLGRSVAFKTASASCKVSSVSVGIAIGTKETSGTAAVFSGTAMNIHEENQVTSCATSTAVVKRKRGRPPKKVSRSINSAMASLTSPVCSSESNKSSAVEHEALVVRTLAVNVTCEDQADTFLSVMSNSSTIHHDILYSPFNYIDKTSTNASNADQILTSAATSQLRLSSIITPISSHISTSLCDVNEAICQHSFASNSSHLSSMLPTDLNYYRVPVMTAQLEPSRFCRALSSSAVSSCETLTVSSATFSLPLCSAVAARQNVLSTGSVLDINNTSFCKYAPYELSVLSDLPSSMSRITHLPMAHSSVQHLTGHIYNVSNSPITPITHRLSSPNGTFASLPATAAASSSQDSRILSTPSSAVLLGASVVQNSSMNRTERPNCFQSYPSGGVSDAVCSVTTPVMANVLLQSGFNTLADDRQQQQGASPITGLSLVRPVAMQDISSLISALIGQQTGNSTTQLPVIAIFNIGHGNSTPSTNMFQLLNLPTSAAGISDHECGVVDAAFNS